MQNKITLAETGLRDGIQALKTILPTDLKVACIHDLVAAGIQQIEVAAFVHPKYVPTMADAEQVCAAIHKKEGVNYMGLVLNERGLDRALNTQLDSVATVVYATDTFSQKNSRMSFEESKIHFQQLAKKAKANNMPLSTGVAAAFGCRYEGQVSHNTVLDLIKFSLDQEVTSIGLADTTGMAIPNQLQELCSQVLDLAGEVPVALHLHNTENRGYSNLYAALLAGVRHFDAAFGGLGGCPFVPNASGNIATEDTAHMLHLMGYETGIDINQVVQVSRKIEQFLGRELDGMMYKLYDKI